jgi:hypothetical protein
MTYPKIVQASSLYLLIIELGDKKNKRFANNGYNSLWHLVKIKILKFNTADFYSGKT